MSSVENEVGWRTRVILSAILVAASLTTFATQERVLAVEGLTTCTNIQDQTIRVLREVSCDSKREMVAHWSAEAVNASPAVKVEYLNLCESKNPSRFSYRAIKSKCSSYQLSKKYFRIVAAPSNPEVISVNAIDAKSAQITLTLPNAGTISAPISYFTFFDQYGSKYRIANQNQRIVLLDGLHPDTVYQFSIAATSLDGTSVPVKVVQQIKTMTSVQSAPDEPSPGPPDPGPHDYAIGDQGPGGGIIFYIDVLGFNCGPTFADTCHYLEVAPSGWYGSAEDPTLIFASHPIVSTYGDVIGLGESETLQMLLTNPTDTITAGTVARNYSGGGLSNWFLPNREELGRLNTYSDSVTGHLGLSYDSNTPDRYWGSSQNNYTFPFGGVGYEFWDADTVSISFLDLLRVRPIRAF